MQLLTRGIARRHTGETKTNTASSRSHCVFTASLESRRTEDGITSFRTSRLHLVDLAGGLLYTPPMHMLLHWLCCCYTCAAVHTPHLHNSE